MTALQFSGSLYDIGSADDAEHRLCFDLGSAELLSVLYKGPLYDGQREAMREIAKRFGQQVRITITVEAS